MRNYKTKTKKNARKGKNNASLLLKKSIKRNRRRAKFVGNLYLLATIALAAAACFPLLIHTLAPIGVMEFWKVFTKLDLKSTTGIFTLANCALYALMLLVVVINVFRSLGKLGMLMSKKGNRDYGFSGNTIAMEKMGKIFSGSLSTIISIYFLIAILCGSAEYNMLTLIVLGGGIVLRILLGFWGAKTGYFDYDGRKIVHDKRTCGRFAPAFRNLLQNAVVVGIIFFFLKINTLNAQIETVLTVGGVDKLLGDLNTLIFAVVQVLILLSTLVLIKHATGMTEYNFDGAEGAGMKNFRVFSFFVFLFAAVAVAYDYFVVKSGKLDMNMAIIAGAAFVMFIIELIMRNAPMSAEEKEARKQAKLEAKNAIDEDELSFDSMFGDEEEVAAPANKKKVVEDDDDEEDWY